MKCNKLAVLEMNIQIKKVIFGFTRLWHKIHIKHNCHFDVSTSLVNQLTKFRHQS